MARLIRTLSIAIYLTIIPRARMGSHDQLIAYEAEGRMAIDSEAMKARGIVV